MEYFVISAKFVPLKYYTLSSQLRRLTSFSVGLFGSANSVTRSYPVMRKSCIQTTGECDFQIDWHVEQPCLKFTLLLCNLLVKSNAEGVHILHCIFQWAIALEINTPYTVNLLTGGWDSNGVVCWTTQLESSLLSIVFWLNLAQRVLEFHVEVFYVLNKYKIFHRGAIDFNAYNSPNSDVGCFYW